MPSAWFKPALIYGRPSSRDNVPTYIQNLASGQAYAIPNTLISAAYTNFTGQYGDHLSCFAYSGGCYDTKRNRLLVTGGGHNDYNGNVVYAFSLYASETPSWTEVRTSTVPPNGTDPAVTYTDQCSNGDPAASHTYYNVTYDERNDKLMLYGLTAFFGATGVSLRPRTLDLATATWDSYGSHSDKPGNGDANAAVYDSGAQLIWSKEAPHNLQLLRYDCTANSTSTVNDSSFRMNVGAAIACNPANRYLIAIGGDGDQGPDWTSAVPDMALWDLSTYDGSSVTRYARDLTGFPASLKFSKLGLEFHPPTKTFVAWVGGNTIYRLIPPSNPFTDDWTFASLTPTGDALPPSCDDRGALGGIFGRFRWAPYPNDSSRGVFVISMLGGTDPTFTEINTYIYKPSF